MPSVESVLIFAAIVLLKCNYAATIRTFPNWWYLGEGYHLLCGNTEPSYTGIPVITYDPGWRFPVISLDITINTTSNDTKYHIPGNTEADYIGKECNLNAETTLYHGDISLSNDLFSQITWYKNSNDEYILNKTAFVASPTFRKYHNKIYEKNDNRILVSADAKCPTYDYFLKPQVPFTLTDEFVLGFTTLTISPTAASCYIFLNTWGTHVVTQIYSGSRYSRVHQFDANSWNAMTWNKFDIPFIANAEYDVSVTNNSNKYNSTVINQVNTFKGLAEALYESVMGIKPFDKILNWLNISTVNPFPWRYTLIPLVDLLVPEYFPHLFPNVVENTQKRVIEAIKTYSNHLICIDDIQVKCPPHEPDIPLPIQIQPNSGRIINNGTQKCDQNGQALSCGFAANVDNNNFDKFWSVYPQYEQGKHLPLCAAEDKDGAELYAICISSVAAKISIVSKTFSWKENPNYAECTGGTLLTGCGMIPLNTGNTSWDADKAIYPDPTTKTKCICQHKYGGTCYALCATNIESLEIMYTESPVQNGHNLSCPTNTRVFGCGIELFGDLSEPSRPSFYAMNTLNEENICVGYYKQSYKLYAICGNFMSPN